MKKYENVKTRGLGLNVFQSCFSNARLIKRAQITLALVNAGPSKICSLPKYLVLQTFYFEQICMMMASISCRNALPYITIGTNLHEFWRTCIECPKIIDTVYRAWCTTRGVVTNFYDRRSLIIYFQDSIDIFFISIIGPILLQLILILPVQVKKN